MFCAIELYNKTSRIKKHVFGMACTYVSNPICLEYERGGNLNSLIKLLQGHDLVNLVY